MLSVLQSVYGLLIFVQVDVICLGYVFDVFVFEMGVFVNGSVLFDVFVCILIVMVNCYGLVVGVIGIGKIKILQVFVEQFVSVGVLVFVVDIKGDFSGIVSFGVVILQFFDCMNGLGQKWVLFVLFIEYFLFGGVGIGILFWVSVKGFGYLLLSKVFGLNLIQEFSLGFVFYYVDQVQLLLIDLFDLCSVFMYLMSDVGKGELDSFGGLLKVMVGVILCELIIFLDQGVDVFFGEFVIDVQKFLCMVFDGVCGLVSLMEVFGV